MEMQVSVMGAIVALPFYTLCLAILMWWLTKTRAKSKSKIIVVLIVAPLVLVAPWVEEFFIAKQFHELCQDAGVHVYKRVRVDGYLNATMRGWPNPQPILDKRLVQEYEETGYRFEETLARGGKISHAEKDENGVWRISILDEPEARYVYRYGYNPSKHVIEKAVGWKILKYEYVVEDLVNKEIIARDVSYNRYPSFFEGVWIGFFGDGQIWCEGDAPTPPILRHLLYHYVLIPGEGE